MRFNIQEGLAGRHVPLFNALVFSLLLHGLGFLPGVLFPAHLLALQPSPKSLQVTLRGKNEVQVAVAGLASESEKSADVGEEFENFSMPREGMSPPAKESLAKNAGGAQGEAKEKTQADDRTKLRPDVPGLDEQSPDIAAYRTDGLDPPPRLLSEIDLVYPESAGLREGRVVLRILINERGIVDNVMVTQAFPKEFFDEAAMAAFRTALFSPGKFLGVPVKSQLLIEVEFLPTNRGANVSGKGY